METMRMLRILGKRGRVTVPQEVRDEIGLERGDVVSFNLVDEDSVLVKREKLCDSCVTQTNQTDMMELLLQAIDRKSVV